MDIGNTAQWLSAGIALCALIIAVASWRRTNRQDAQEQIGSLKRSVETKFDSIQHTQGEIEQRITKIETAQEHGINREDVDKLHHRINVLVRESGAHTALLESLAKHLDRLDQYMHKLSP